MSRPYNSGQVKTIFPYCKDPDWFILGGPADGDEAQCFIKQFPNCKVLACEPDITMLKWQLANNFPQPSRLLWCALSDKTGQEPFKSNPDNPRCSSLMMDREGESTMVDTTTLDALHRTYTFTRAVLWLDIEGWEYRALQGARSILHQGLVDVINLEVLHRLVDEYRGIVRLMEEFGFELALRWNQNEGHHDRIYVRKESLK